MSPLLKALIQKQLGEIEVAKANVQVYQEHPAGIGEHPGIGHEIEILIGQIDSLDSKIDTIKKYYDIPRTAGNN